MIILKHQAKSLGMILISVLGFSKPINAEEIWDSFTFVSEQRKLPNDFKDLDSKGVTTKKKLRPTSEYSLFDSKNLVWKLIPKNNYQNGNLPTWQRLSPSETKLLIPNSWDTANIGISKIPSDYKTAISMYKQLEPIRADYLWPTRLSPSFPTGNLLEKGDNQIKVFSLSAFSGGDASGTGNQNYAFRFDIGMLENLQVSGFFSAADDPLYSTPNSHSTNQTPNFWESYGASLKTPLYKQNNWSIALESSIELWNVQSGAPNIFNSSNKLVSTKNLVGSITLPASFQVTKDLQVSILSGISFLPQKQGHNQGGEGTFYGNNIFAGTGLMWRPISKITFLTSAILPLGPGDNSFNSDLDFKKKPILNFGIDWDLNPRIGLEGRLTNGFGATPSTGILTLPSANQLGYYAGIKYTPSAIDSPQREFTFRETSLSKGGLTVGSALIPPGGTTQAWGNLDSSGNVFGYLGHSISNNFQLDIINLGKFNDIPPREGNTKAIVNEYLSNNGVKTRVGGKIILLSPKSKIPIWTALRLSAGRSRWLSGGQGYLFSEFITTWEPTRRIAININPKAAWNNISTPKGVGLGANIQVSKKLQLIPEYNLVESPKDNNNYTIALRWLLTEDFNIDIYGSSAAGLQDIGQLIGADETKLGTRFNLTY